MWKLLFVLASAIGVYGSPPYGYGGLGSPYGRGRGFVNPYGAGGYNTRYNYGYNNGYNNGYGGQTQAYAKPTTTMWDRFGTMGGWNPYGAGGYNTRYNYGNNGYGGQTQAYAKPTTTMWDRFGTMGGWNPYGAGGYNTRYNYGNNGYGGQNVATSSAFRGFQSTPASMIFRTSRRVGGGVVRPAPGGGLRIGASYSTDVVALPPVSVQIWPATVVPPPPASNGGACGGIIKLPTKGVKYIQSPNYPKDYPRRSDCVFSIIAPKGKSIQLQFVAMAIEKHARCVWDFIEIFKGGRNGKNITKLCSMKLRTYKIAGGRATVYFHSDGSVQKKGFKIKMSAV